MALLSSCPPWVGRYVLYGSCLHCHCRFSLILLPKSPVEIFSGASEVNLKVWGLGLVRQFSLRQSAGALIGTSSPTNHSRLVSVSDFLPCVLAVLAAVGKRADPEPTCAGVNTEWLQ